MPAFKIDWLGKDARILGTIILDKPSLEFAGNAASRKWLQSQHLIPEGCRGFYITALEVAEQTLEIKQPLEKWEVSYEKARAEGFGE